MYNAQESPARDIEKGFLGGHFPAQLRLKKTATTVDVHMDTLPFKLGPGELSAEMTDEITLRLQRAAEEVAKKDASAEGTDAKWECDTCTYVASSSSQDRLACLLACLLAALFPPFFDQRHTERQLFSFALCP